MTLGKKNLTLAQVKQKLYHYCAYQERSHYEVKKKLYSLHVRSSDVEEIMAHLITEGFLNEERYAKAFAGGKFRLKHWGRNKIIHALEGKSISKNCIKAALSEIDNESYIQTINHLIEKKSNELKDLSLLNKRNKVTLFLIQKGYEPELVRELINKNIPYKPT